MVLRVWFQEIFLEVNQLFDLKLSLSLYVYVIFLLLHQLEFIIQLCTQVNLNNNPPFLEEI